MRLREAVSQDLIDSCILKPALARNTDPETSHIAARLITGSGKAVSDRRKLIYFLNERSRKQGWTYTEIAAAILMDKYDVARRLPECKPAFIRTEGRRSGKQCWFPK